MARRLDTPHGPRQNCEETRPKRGVLKYVNPVASLWQTRGDQTLRQESRGHHQPDLTLREDGIIEQDHEEEAPNPSLQLVRGGGGATHPRLSLPSPPIPYSHAHSLIPSPSPVLSRAAPAHKAHRYSAEEPTRAACASLSTYRPCQSSHHRSRRKALGYVRTPLVPLQRPRLLVVVVNTRTHPHRLRDRRRGARSPLPSRTHFTTGCRSSVRPRSRRGGLGLLRRCAWIVKSICTTPHRPRSNSLGGDGYARSGDGYGPVSHALSERPAPTSPVVSIRAGGGQICWV